MLGTKKALSQYGGVANTADNASPHRLVQMLMQSILDKLSAARGQIERKDFAGKSVSISGAMSVVNALRSSLDMQSGGEVAVNLNDLYGYIYNRLVDANAHNDVSALEECASLIGEIKSAWDAMPEEVKHMPRPAGNEAQAARAYR